jgi:AraC-like DNA-binding protein
MHEQIRLSFVAKYVGRVSVSHLARLFQQQHRMSFAEYLRKIRMHRASRLLAGADDLSIRQIAAKVGYRDPSRFTEHFRRCFGTTPRSYRRFTRPRKKDLRGPSTR